MRSAYLNLVRCLIEDTDDDVVSGILADANIVGYVTAYLPDFKPRQFPWVGDREAVSTYSDGYDKALIRNAHVTKRPPNLRVVSDENREHYKVFPVYGDPKTHGWAALSPFLSADTIPPELRPQYEYSKHYESLEWDARMT